MAISKLFFILLISVTYLIFVSSKEIIEATSVLGVEVFHSGKNIAEENRVEDVIDQNAGACECGKNSISCKYEDSKKICTCQPGFSPGDYGLCVESCSENRTCDNGGICLQNVCVCLPGTSGPFCKTVDDCDNRLCGVDEDTFCEYDIEKQKAICRCRIYEYKYDVVSRICKDCACDAWYQRNPEAWSNCEYIQGEKICTCKEKYAYSREKEICIHCDCDKKAKWCEVDRLDYSKCVCEDGYLDRFDTCEKCDCGENGFCVNPTMPEYIRCICDEGFQVYNDKCIPCKCGKYGKCVFDKSGKEVACECEAGYAENKVNGKCEICYCGENSVNCSFDAYGSRDCECSEGYTNIKRFCEDINECLWKKNPCPQNSAKCINTPGSYKCVCAEGYTPAVEITVLEVCADINECEDPTSCNQPNTECINTQGSYMCICESGYIAKGGRDNSLICEESPDYLIYSVVIATVCVAVIMSLGIFFYTKRYLESESSIPYHEMDSK